mmetsp:Transcript_37809/g.116828  ORF Transcript_37809/g.116828 Transcript_37809/m.116828 type:complete len:283 (+) Transcript_37809:525-1373(+)
MKLARVETKVRNGAVYRMGDSTMKKMCERFLATKYAVVDIPADASRQYTICSLPKTRRAAVTPVMPIAMHVSEACEMSGSSIGRSKNCFRSAGALPSNADRDLLTICDGSGGRYLDWLKTRPRKKPETNTNPRSMKNQRMSREICVIDRIRKYLTCTKKFGIFRCFARSARTRPEGARDSPALRMDAASTAGSSHAIFSAPARSGLASLLLLAAAPSPVSGLNDALDSLNCDARHLSAISSIVIPVESPEMTSIMKSGGFTCSGHWRPRSCSKYPSAVCGAP